MRLTKSMLVMLLCCGLIITFGLTACGDDDDVEEDGGNACGEAYDQFVSEECTTQAFAHVNELKACFETAVSVEDEDACFASFFDDTPDCLPGAQILFDGCGQCQEDCGTAFAGDDGAPGCLQGAQTGTECLQALINCVNAC